jgi:hypothetical protein
MTHDLDNLRLPPRPDFPVKPLQEVETSTEQLPSPALVSDAVGPEVGAGERREGSDRISDEAAGGVSVHAEEEWDEQVMRVPEGLVRLLADLVVCGGEHHEHAQQHDVTCDASRLGVVNLDGRLGTNL